MAANRIDPREKYSPYVPVELPDRQWPSQTIKTAPVWCSVDLRDGNQALPIPMSREEKVAYFQLLVELGFKEIEVGYPSASETDFAFVRHLITEAMIPEDVTIQVITPCIEELIDRTFDAIVGAPRVILHFLNGTSPLQRELVYLADEEATVSLAKTAAAYIRKKGEAAKQAGMAITYEYSPESFSETEPTFALTIVEAVLDTLEASASAPVIINLPATVEKCAPNQYADLVEWFARRLRDKARVVLSIHPHNDRGTAVAAAEMALLAGAQRVEGTLFGNGERTGNADLLTLAMNMYTQGVETGLCFQEINKVREVFEAVTRMKVGARHPYAGELVYTAFSGAHQDAILKVINYRKKRKLSGWQVPYLPLDPADVGRQYEPIIRINSQSGKGGAGFIMESLFGYQIPKAMLPELSLVVKEKADRENIEITGETLLGIFDTEFISVQTPYSLESYRTAYLNEEDEEDNEVRFLGTVKENGVLKEVEGKGNGPIDALYDALKTLGAADYEFVSYAQHAISGGSDSRAIAYIQLRDKEGRTRFGAGTSKDIKKASLRALISAINRMSRRDA